jgi:hypothetical protein
MTKVEALKTIVCVFFEKCVTCAKLLCVHFNVASDRPISLGVSNRMEFRSNTFLIPSNDGGRPALLMTGLVVADLALLVRRSLFTEFESDFGEILDDRYESWLKNWTRHVQLFGE